MPNPTERKHTPNKPKKPKFLGKTKLELASQVYVPTSLPWHDFCVLSVLICACAHSRNFKWMAGQLQTFSHDKRALREHL